jgi:hypothetical protein
MSGGVLYVKDAPFSIVREQRGKVFSFYLSLIMFLDRTCSSIGI